MGVTCRLYREGRIAEEGFDPARVSDFLAEKDTLVWLDLEDPTEEELALLEDEFAIHPLAIEDTLHRGQRAKVEAFEDHLFVALHAFRESSDDLVDCEIHAFIGGNYLVTLRYAPAFDMASVRQRWEKQRALASEGPGFLLYVILDEVVDDYFAIVERMEDRADDLEGRVFAEDTVPGIQEHIFGMKKRVLQFRRRAVPLRQVLNRLSQEATLVTDRLRPYFRDVEDHLIRVTEFLDNMRELLNTALEAHLSQVSNRLNQVMKQLTSWAAIILVPTLIAGIYGMNFRRMPELEWVFGYPFALGLMVLSGATLYWMFKRRDWL